MVSFKNIEDKLHQFTRKYYTSELIKGSILFLSLGFIYFFFTLFLEYFLWLKPTERTILFWLLGRCQAIFDKLKQNPTLLIKTVKTVKF